MQPLLPPFMESYKREEHASVSDNSNFSMPTVPQHHHHHSQASYQPNFHPGLIPPFAPSSNNNPSTTTSSNPINSIPIATTANVQPEKPVKKRRQSTATNKSNGDVNNHQPSQQQQTNSNDDPESPKKKKKRKQVKRACINCHKSHAGCDDVRPCKRCVSLGLEATCLDVEPRNNKRKTNASNSSTSNTTDGANNPASNSSLKPQTKPTATDSPSRYNNNNNIGNATFYSWTSGAPAAQSAHYQSLHHPLFPPPNSAKLSSPSMSQHSGGSSGSPFHSYHPVSSSNNGANNQRGGALLPPPSSLIGSPSDIFTDSASRAPSSSSISPQSHLALLNSVMMQQQILLQALQKLDTTGSLDPSLTQNLISGNQALLSHTSSLHSSEKVTSPHYLLPPPSTLSAQSPSLLPSVNTSSLASPNAHSHLINRTYSSSSLEGLLGPPTPTAATPLGHHSVSTPVPVATPVPTVHDPSLTLNDSQSNHNHATKSTNADQKSSDNNQNDDGKSDGIEKEEDGAEDEFIGFFRRPSNNVDIIDDYFALFNSNVSDDGYIEENNVITGASSSSIPTTSPGGNVMLSEVHQGSDGALSQSTSFTLESTSPISNAVNTCILNKNQLEDPDKCSGCVHLPSGEADTIMCVAIWKLNGVLFSANKNFFTVFGVPSLSDNLQINFSSILDMDHDPDLKQVFSCRSDFVAKSIKMQKYVDHSTKKDNSIPREQIEGYMQAYVIRNAQGILPRYISTHISVATKL
ncbi:hypothetical protein C9374_011021 [Naegleria lovaniensis]|uniref:Zn(2)-C6 fungal-type domain-containing protein n=1 Tax=Naegleria lovaniensis TaxID=51637 RepID=A0AA88GF04_NAELO|nr:uncharacterized protein C9374_011021 [Naegleria lovaniensis]KAG2374184.1 hypothetical protein C9374_011021 [Naegleria lovaniensis]